MFDVYVRGPEMRPRGPFSELAYLFKAIMPRGMVRVHDVEVDPDVEQHAIRRSGVGIFPQVFHHGIYVGSSEMFSELFRRWKFLDGWRMGGHAVSAPSNVLAPTARVSIDAPSFMVSLGAKIWTATYSGLLTLDDGSDTIVIGRVDGLVSAMRVGVAGARERLAIGYADGRIKIEQYEWQAHLGRVLDIGYTDDGLVTAGADGRLCLWSTDGRLIHERDVVVDDLAVVACWDERVMVIGTAGGKLLSADVVKGATTLASVDEPVVAICHDGANRLFFGTAGHAVMLLERERITDLSELGVPPGVPMQICVDAQGVAYVRSSDGLVTAWDALGKQALDPVATGAASIGIWRGRVVAKDRRAAWLPVVTGDVRRHVAPIWSVWSRASTRPVVVAGGADGRISFTDPSSIQHSPAAVVHRVPGWVTGVHGWGDLVVSVSTSGVVKAFDVVRNELVGEWKLDAWLNCVSVAPAGEWAVAATAEGECVRWNLSAAAKLSWKVTGQAQWASSISASCESVAVVGFGGVLEILDAGSGRILRSESLGCVLTGVRWLSADLSPEDGLMVISLDGSVYHVASEVQKVFTVDSRLWAIDARDGLCCVVAIDGQGFLWDRARGVFCRFQTASDVVACTLGMDGANQVIDLGHRDGKLERIRMSDLIERV